VRYVVVVVLVMVSTSGMTPMVTVAVGPVVGPVVVKALPLVKYVVTVFRVSGYAYTTVAVGCSGFAECVVEDGAELKGS
jgi:hypothetical protein